MSALRAVPVPPPSALLVMAEEALAAQERARAAQRKAERLQSMADTKIAAVMLELAAAAEAQ